MIRSLMLLLLFVSALSQSAAAITLDELQQRSASHPLIRAEFEQAKYISGLSQPLKSSGKVIISQRRGLWWHQVKPFDLTLLLTENRMAQTVSGQAPRVITNETNPQLFQFNRLLIALFHADKAVLEKNFTVDLRANGPNDWRLTLIPKSTPLDKLFRQITLTGRDFLESIDIDDMQNDTTSIRFFNHRAQPEQLTNEELRRFVP